MSENIAEPSSSQQKAQMMATSTCATVADDIKAQSARTGILGSRAGAVWLAAGLERYDIPQKPRLSNPSNTGQTHNDPTLIWSSQIRG